MQTFLFLNLGTPELIMVLITGLVPVSLMIICLVDIVRSNFKDNTSKLLWILIVLFAPLIGSLIYLLMGRGQKVIA